MVRTFISVISIVILCCLAVVVSAVPATLIKPIKLSSNSQLFLDDYLVANTINIERKLNHPKKHPSNPLIVGDFPWEKRLVEIYGTVLFDPNLNKYRCWYLANEFNNGIPDNPEHPKTAEYYTCYAESDDGIKWHKPMVGSEPFGRHKEHNIIIPDGHGWCVLPTPEDSDPNKKYKGAGGANFGFSPDGINWTLYNWQDKIGKNDTSTSFVKWKDEYLAYVRYQIEDPNWPGVMRGVGLSTSTDFINWTPKELVFKTETKDGYPWTQPYGLAVTPYGDILIGILWTIRLDKVDGNNSFGDQDMQLLVSRDGRNWSYVANGAIFMEGTPDSWDEERVFPGTTMFVKDNNVHIYYTGTNTRHGENWGAPGIGLATLPVDRFVALEQSDSNSQGVIQTKLLTFTGNNLLVNTDACENDLQVELLDKTGKVMPGFARHNSRLIVHDKLHYKVVWGAEGNQRYFGSAKNKRPVAIRFILRNGKSLYAFQIVGNRPDDFGKQWVRNHPFTIMGLTLRDTVFDAEEYANCNFSDVLVWKNREGFYQKMSKSELTWHSHILRKPSREEPVGKADPFTGEIKERAKRLYNTYPGCKGWVLWDEPYTTQLPKLGEAIEWFKQNFPDTLVYTNAYPGKDLGNNYGKYYGTKWVGPDLYEDPPVPYSYYHYIKDIAQIAKPDVLAFDIYPFKILPEHDGDDYLFKRFFSSLEAVRKVAMEEDMPYWIFVQTFAKTNYARFPSEVDLRMQVFTSLAYGFTGIIYFTYDSAFPDGSGLLKDGGEPSNLYHAVGEINSEIANLGDILRFLKSTDVVYVPGRNKDSVVIAENPLPHGVQLFDPNKHASGNIEEISIHEMGSKNNVLVGFFVDENKDSYFMPVNLRYGERLDLATAAIEMEIKFTPDVKKVSRISRKTGKPEVLNLTNNSLKLELLGGTGDLFKIGNAVLSH